MKRDRDRAAAGKENMWLDHDAAGMDELFAVLGYKVKSSDMADVADKLEQLDMAMATTTMADNGDIFHYNPCDLSGWVGSLYSDLDINTNLIGASDDLRAIPGSAIFGAKKRIKSELPKYGCLSAHPVLLVDSQEAGVSLVHTLMACAEAVQQGNVKLAGALLRNVGVLAVSQVGAMRKVATYFAEALARKIYKIYPSASLDCDVLQMHFYETGPYLKFAHFTANQSMLEAFAGENRVHVVDFSLKQGMQWPALMHALALRPGGPPRFRLTGIGPPQPDNSDDLQQVGLELAQLANTIGVEFEFRGFVASSLADLDASMLSIGPGNDEAVAINSIFELHGLLSRPGAIDKILDLIRMISPKIVTMVEQEANHNGEDFLERFNGALHYYSNVFDSLESSGPARPDKQDIAMTEIYLGRQICNVVACEGADRVERHETLALWRRRLRSAGFDQVHMCSNAFKQASMLLELFAGGHGYRVEENDGCLMLGWHTRPLIASSAWRLVAGGRLGLDSESWVDSERVGGHHTTSGGRAEMG